METRKAPIYEKRRLIVAGEDKDFSEYIPKFDEAHASLTAQCAKIVKTDSEDDKPKEIKEVDVEPLKGKDGIPDFWYRAIKNNQMIFELVKEKDEEILKSLYHVEASKTFTPAKNLSVKFHFRPNEYFENTTLELKVFYKGENDDPEKIEGTAIKWIEGKDVTHKKVKKKQKHKKTNETRTIVKTVEAESFFNAFCNRVAPEDDTQIDEEEVNEIMEKIDQAVNLAEDVFDVLIPDALEYYLGLNDDLYDADMMEGEDDSDEDGSGGDSDEDDKKKGAKKEKKPKGGKGAEAKPDAEGQKECKQQ